jgi:imidazolonepropionase-like amidohydrolase
MYASLARHARRAFALALLLAAASAPAHAQFVNPPRPAAYALRGVTVMSAHGVPAPGRDVIVRGERIVAIGTGLTIPPDALELQGDSLVIYPGIVDAWGAVKFAFPRDSVDRTQLRSWDPPRAVIGFAPHRLVLDVLTPDSTELSALRRKGVVAVAVQPTEGLMPGRGALLLLRDTVAGVAGLAIDPVLGPVATLRGTRGFYPSTGMAVPTFFRQALLDSERRSRIRQATPRGAVPPPFDADDAVLREVLAGRVPVFFVADDADEIRTVLRIADDFRIRPVLMGGAEAWQLAPELKRRDIPVLVSLDFPKPVRWKPDARKDSVQAPAAVREQRELEARYANAGRLAAAGVRVALTSGGKANIREAARQVIEHGMSERDALEAVTLTPARLFGFERLASIAENGPATFTVTDGPLFEKETKVRYTFVEGVLERAASAANDTTKQGEKSDSAAADVALDSIAGRWAFEAKANVGDVISGTMTLAQDGETITGSVELGELGTAPIRSGTFVDGRLSMTLSVTSGGQNLTIELSGRREGNTLAGTGTGPTGPFEWTATRTPGELR